MPISDVNNLNIEKEDDSENPFIITPNVGQLKSKQ